MILTQIPMNLIAEDYSEVKSTRSPGIHLTQIIHAMEKSLFPDRYKHQFTEDQLSNYASVGFMWERILGKIMLETAIEKRSDSLIRPSELELDGIYMSPDAIDMQGWVLEEYKASWLGSNRDIATDPVFWKYWVQVKAYCKGLGCSKARLKVLFVNGSWKPPVPESKAWEAEFSEREIEENWSSIKNYARSKGWIG